MMKMKYLMCVLCFMAITGCSNWSGYSGVQNEWRSPQAPQWNVGVTTEAEVADAFGPPSQLIALKNETVYYYMREGKSGNALTFIVWNQGSQDTVYDRAVFFFDANGVLVKYSYSHEELPYEPDKD